MESIERVVELATKADKAWDEYAEITRDVGAIPERQRTKLHTKAVEYALDNAVDTAYALAEAAHGINIEDVPEQHRAIVQYARDNFETDVVLTGIMEATEQAIEESVMDAIAQLEADGMIRWTGEYRNGSKVYVATEKGMEATDDE